VNVSNGVRRSTIIIQFSLVHFIFKFIWNLAKCLRLQSEYQFAQNWPTVYDKYSRPTQTTWAEHTDI